MVTHIKFKIAIKRIAELFTNDPIQQEGIINRLETYFNNETIKLFLSQLQSKRFYKGSFSLPMIYHKYLKSWLSRFDYMDLLTGASGYNSVKLPPSVYNESVTDWKKVIEYVNSPYLSFVNIMNNEIIFSSSEYGGYGIEAVQPQPLNNYSQGSSNIDIKPIDKPIIQAVQQEMKKENLTDFNKLILPVIIVLGAYFLINK